MAMKVTGTGAPRMLTVRFRPCEVGVAAARGIDPLPSDLVSGSRR